MTVLGAYTGNIRDNLGWLNSAGRPNVFHRANLPRTCGDVAITTTGKMHSVALYLSEGDLVTNLTVSSGATAGATLTHHWAALYSPAGALLSQSADRVDEAWAADTVKTFALGAAQRIPVSGVYFAAVMIAASTIPTLLGSVSMAPLLTGEHNLGQVSGASLTTTAPATIATPAVHRAVPLVVAT